MNEVRKQGSQFLETSFMLRAKSWKNYLPELQYKFIIARAFNDVLYDTGPVYKKFLITGYLIHRRRIYIVCKLRSISIDRVLELLHEKIKLALELEEQKRIEKKRFNESTDVQHLSIPETGFFDFFPFNNEWLKLLITGHAVNLRYHDPLLDNLKNIVSNEPFCSCIDYSGEKGPVIVSIPKKEKVSGNPKRKSKRKRL